MKMKITLLLLCFCSIQFIGCSGPNDNLIKDVKQTEYKGYNEWMGHGPYQNFTFKLNGVKYSTNIPKSHTFRQKEEFLKKIILGDVYTSALSENKKTLINKVLEKKLKVTKFYGVDDKREKKLLEKYNGNEVGILSVDVGGPLRVDVYRILFVISSKKIILLDIYKR